ncbi:unnamed protein product (mitochondrion) [Plasmodiophora brassicae]|uniref:NEK6-subfamily protein kinase n=1 Tax=Plasmodiophora brassicae TaxID=37360 RepID=A0A3P3YKN8_PLABS|nr:unnamed protein product [Plasmodiophora brassicae]
MLVTVSVGGGLKMRIPCGNGSQRVGWLQSEVIRRWAARKDGDVLRILELKTINNASLDPDDQIAEVLRDEDTVIAVLKTSSDRVMVGDMFAHRYYVTGVLGEGTYGHVFRARDLELERDVALKCLKKSRATRLSTKRFLREARVTASLGFHTNIVTLYDSGRTEDGTLFLVMELLHGESMTALLERHVSERQAISERMCAEIFVPLLDGLHAAHSLNPPVVHRDLKPDNVFLAKPSHAGDPAVPVILDFGIAVSSDLLHDTAPCGTRMYSSPEQTRRGAQIDARSDLWSLGVMLYQCVTLFVDMPFDPFELRAAEGVVPDVRLHAFQPVSDAFADIIMKSLEVDVDRRWQTALEFRQAFLALHDLDASRRTPSRAFHATASKL